MRQLSPRQADALAFIRESLTLRGYPPTIREIGAHMGIRSTNGVNDHLRALERKGIIRIEHSRARGIALTDLGMGAVCPCCGGAIQLEATA